MESVGTVREERKVGEELKLGFVEEAGTRQRELLKKFPLDSLKTFGAKVLCGVRVARFRLWEVTPARFPLFVRVRYHATAHRAVVPCRFAPMNA